MGNKENTSAELYPGEFERNRFFLQLSRELVRTGKIPMGKGIEIDAGDEIIENAHRKISILHKRQRELARAGLKSKDIEITDL